jgi:hypothetical protein
MKTYEQQVMSLSDEQYNHYFDLRKSGVSCVDALIAVEEIQ